MLYGSKASGCTPCSQAREKSIFCSQASVEAEKQIAAAKAKTGGTGSTEGTEKSDTGSRKTASP